MFKLIGLKGQVLELRGLLEQKDKIISNIEYQRDYWKRSFKHENLICEGFRNDLDKVKKDLTLDGQYIPPSELMRVFKSKCKDNQEKVTKINELEKRLDNLIIKNKEYIRENKDYLNDLIKYEKEIKELKERNEFLIKENRKNWKAIRQIKDEDKEIIKQYLVKKYLLLVDQKAPTLLLELIDNLIQELKNE